MRIIGGEKKGVEIKGPGPKDIRPMRELVRRAMFDMLRQVIEDSRFLDLFAGTGSVGLEALSRGAKKVTFVDNFPKAVSLIEQNLELLGYEERADVYQMEAEDAIDFFERKGEKFDLAFLGPPYGKDLTKEILKALNGSKTVRPGGIVAAEVFKKNEINNKFNNFNLLKERVYGQNKLIIMRKKVNQEKDY